MCIRDRQADQWTGTKDTRKEIPFVRAAKSGGWRSELPAPMVEKIEAAWGPIMRTLGYELTTRSASELREHEFLGALSSTPR